MCEPLKNKRNQIIWESENDIPKDVIVGEFYTKHDVASAVKFYWKYKDNPLLLTAKYPELKKDVEWFGISNINKDAYNHWLFRYTFSDVIE